MSKSNREWAEKLHDSELRVGAVIWLAGVLADGREDAEPFDDFWFDMQDSSDLLEVFPDAPEDLLDLLEEGDPVPGDLPMWLLGERKLGFLVRVETPVMEKLPNGGKTFSWGMYTTHWAYGDTLDEACEKGLKWVAEVREREEKKEEA